MSSSFFFEKKNSGPVRFLAKMDDGCRLAVVLMYVSPCTKKISEKKMNLIFHPESLVLSPCLSVPHPFGIEVFFRSATSIFPNATVVVAISNAKLSPLFPGAMNEIGLVPKVAFDPRVG